MTKIWFLLFLTSLTIGLNYGQKLKTRKCTLPPDSGHCKDNNNKFNKSQTRYYYSALNFECAKFPYFGSGGNANNFLTEADCLKQCTKTEEITSVQEIRRAQKMGKCWYNGKFYKVREQIPEISKDHGCAQGCFCSEGEELSPAPKITCAQLSCGNFGPESNGCVLIYNNSRSCCFDDFKCPKQNDFKCIYKGQTYVEGERFYPEEFPCFTCTCSRKFNGQLNVNDLCQEVNCGLNIFYQEQRAKNCKPEYYESPRTGEKLCCPINWKC